MGFFLNKEQRELIDSCKDPLFEKVYAQLKKKFEQDAKALIEQNMAPLMDHLRHLGKNVDEIIEKNIRKEIEKHKNKLGLK